MTSFGSNYYQTLRDEKRSIFEKARDAQKRSELKREKEREILGDPAQLLRYIFVSELSSELCARIHGVCCTLHKNSLFHESNEAGRTLVPWNK